MEAERIINGAREKLFSILTNSLLADIQQAGNEDVSVEDIKEGYSYRKQLTTKLGKEGTIKVIVTKFEAPHVYEATFESAQGFNVLSYTLEEVDDDHFKLIYKEDFMSEKTSRNMNYGLMSKLYKRSSKKKINLVLDQIETLMNE